MKKQVLSIGQCAFDHSNISQMLNEKFDVEIQTAESHDEAMEKIRESRFDLILVNRLYDAAGTPGLDTIGEITALEKGSEYPVMLISNYEQDGESDRELENEDEDFDTKKSRIRLSNWDDVIIWMFSKEKWTPIMNRLKRIANVLIDPAVLSELFPESQLNGSNE